MRSKVLLIGLVAAVAFGATAFGFDAYFADASGNKIDGIWEGNTLYIVVDDPDKGACGIDEFYADLVIFDFKTGAYIEIDVDPATDDPNFREFTAGSGKYFLVDTNGNKRGIKVGDRKDWTDLAEMEHVVGPDWEDGNWIYVDEEVEEFGWGGSTDMGDLLWLPQDQWAERFQYTHYLDPVTGARIPGEGDLPGRFENMDTLILIVADETDERNIDQDQVKVVDTVATLTVTPTTLAYGCGAVCDNIVVTIVDYDENLNCDKVDYVPFWVIVNPGSWVPDDPQTPADRITTFCALKMTGGVDATGNPLRGGGQPIRWYNVYDDPITYTLRDPLNPANNVAVESRYLDYPNTWIDPVVLTANGGVGLGRVLFYAAETGVNTGEFTYNFGNLEQLQYALGFDMFSPGTTIAFYYLDPNDFDDFMIATAQVGDRPHSETFITDATGVPVDEVKIGHTGLYVRVYDADANINACCQDKVVVHLCDPHNEDDSEYWVIDEVSNDSGIFGSQSGMPLLPVWDAVGGYQLVFDSWTFEAFNEDTIYARYNSVDYPQAELNLLGDGNPNDGAFPLLPDDTTDRYQPWDVSFDQVKVYDYQVFDVPVDAVGSRQCGEFIRGGTHHMRFLNGQYQPVDEIPISGSLYLEVTDLDQNENPLLRELVFGGWNKDSAAGEAVSIGNNLSATATWEEDSAPIWDIGEPPNGVEGAPTSTQDIMTPDGATGGVALRLNSISDIPATVKVFIWNAQTGWWERMDLRETAVGSGIFRSTVCVPVAGGDGSLHSTAGDTVFAFYQDPSNHSDIAILSIKVSEGGAPGITPPVAELEVSFDAAQYVPGDRVTITVTDSAYAGAPEIAGTDVLVLKDATGAEIASWDSIPAVDTNQFQVTYVLPDDVVLGTITAIYTDPVIVGRTAEATAEVVAAELSDVSGISVSPNPFDLSTTFSIVATPPNAVADSLEIAIYDLTGRKVAELSGTNTASVSWDGGSLRNGAYIYVAVVEGAGKTWTFRGFVYIKR